MSGSYKKSDLLLSRAKSPTGPMSPVVSPLKTRIYSKNPLGEDQTKFFGSNFGGTGLQETPSIIGMGKSAK